jgi:hypothetical protein
MQIVNLYRYEREPGKITTSPVKPDDNIDYSIIYRLIADEGMAITNGSSIVECVDTNSLEDWADCKAPISDYNDLGGNYG